MSGIFRYTKSIAGSLFIASLVFCARYGQSWVFRDVDDLRPVPAISVVAATPHLAGGKSHSPMRTQNVPETATWKIGVVTNRTEASLPASFVRTVGRTSDSQRSLKQQVADAIYATAESTVGFTDISVPTTRSRGTCPLEPSKQTAYIHVQPLTATTEDVFVFVHGFNVTLEASLARVAQVAEDMPFHGVAIAFSWQSIAEPTAYLTDEKLAERHFWALAEHLVKVRQRLDNDVRVHLLAHSMGNRVALRALNALTGRIGPTGADVDPFLAAKLSRGSTVTSNTDLFRQKPESKSGVLTATGEIPIRFPNWGLWRTSKVTKPPLTNLILAAPDVDSSEFTRFVRAIRHVCRNTILYASDTDLALEASRKLHGRGYRAGDSRANLRIDHLRTVKVTGVDAKDPLGHSYYGSNTKVLNQLYSLMKPPVDISKPVSEWRSSSQ